MRTCSRVSRGSLRRGCLPLPFPCPLPFSPSPSFSLSPFFPLPLFSWLQGLCGGRLHRAEGLGVSGHHPIHTLSHPQPFAQDLISPRPQFPIFRQIHSEPGGSHAAGWPPPGWRSRGEHRAEPPWCRAPGAAGDTAPWCVPSLLLFWALCLPERAARRKSPPTAHPALFMLAVGPFALFYPASLIRTRDFFGLKKSAVLPLLPPPSPAPWKFR